MRTFLLIMILVVAFNIWFAFRLWLVAELKERKERNEQTTSFQK